MAQRKSSWSDWEDEKGDDREEELEGDKKVLRLSSSIKKLSNEIVDQPIRAVAESSLPTTITASIDSASIHAWDFSALEKEVEGLLATENREPDLSTTSSEKSGAVLLAWIDKMNKVDQHCLSDTEKILLQWRSLIYTLRWHILHVLVEITNNNCSSQECLKLDEILQCSVASTPVTDMADVMTKHLELRRTLDVVHFDNIDEFRCQLEKIFKKGPISISVQWLRHRDESEDVTPSFINSYVLQQSEKHIESERINCLSSSEIFQDSKDIQRDILRVNEKIIVGTEGYDATISAIQSAIERLFECAKLKTGSNCIIADTSGIAREILHACNRTESGGVSYEIMSSFLTNHSIRHIICRPESASAEPISIQIELGCFPEPQDEGRMQCWCFGIHARFAAVTWYSICRAEGDMEEMYRVLATYRNQLMFPCGVTPVYPSDQVIKGSAVVDLQLVCV